jgi:hypothetical protein
MTTHHARENDGPSPSRRADDLDRHGTRVRIDEVAALLRQARRLTSTGGGSDSDRAAFLERKARLLRRLDPGDQPRRDGESR